ncbi:Myc-type basic helix-loop-helix (bHLH) domain [Arabidopsis suecica]|uniref:Myc-type basic helix-loop-helix (BHLH) domain n=1 Tax=Arabidopsis suecica TaxID=45249 RepID=A0A8T1ZFA2_ARASU|nr:Myc-type basic helix-loop-helix (bHLH) domain [Arabidopsis suecica]
MTEEFEIAGISTGAWWSSPTNTATVFSGYSLPRSTEISLDVTNFGWQNFDNKINNPNDGFINMHNSFFEGLFDPNEQLLPDSWPKITVPNAKSELLESFPFLDNMFLIDTEAESFLDHEIRNHNSKEQTTQDCKNFTSKGSERTEELEENSDEYSPRLLKRQRLETLSPLPSFKVRKEKLGDRITALQQLVSPFGKTDTASVLNEAVEYIKFLQEQVTVLSNPDQNTIGSVQQQQVLKISYMLTTLILVLLLVISRIFSKTNHHQLMILELIIINSVRTRNLSILKKKKKNVVQEHM